MKSWVGHRKLLFLFLFEFKKKIHISMIVDEEFLRWSNPEIIGGNTMDTYKINFGMLLMFFLSKIYLYKDFVNNYKKRIMWGKEIFE